jgi:hypothetical protein
MRAMQANLKSTRTTSAMVLSRALRMKGQRIPPEGARFLLNLGISSADKKRTLKLLERHREGRASARDREELESYVQADNLLSILKAQAILALEEAGQEP